MTNTRIHKCTANMLNIPSRINLCVLHKCTMYTLKRKRNCSMPIKEISHQKVLEKHGGKTVPPSGNLIAEKRKKSGFYKTDLLDIAGRILLVNRLGRNGTSPPHLHLTIVNGSFCITILQYNSAIQFCVTIINGSFEFLATLVALHFTPVSKSVGIVSD